jgi:hypothetical protein
MLTFDKSLWISTITPYHSIKLDVYVLHEIKPIEIYIAGDRYILHIAHKRLKIYMLEYCALNPRFSIFL